MKLKTLGSTNSCQTEKHARPEQDLSKVVIFRIHCYFEMCITVDLVSVFCVLTFVAEHYDWLGCWGRHMKAQGFKSIRDYQKLNHFPGSFQIGRKDRLWRNLSKLQVKKLYVLTLRWQDKILVFNFDNLNNFWKKFFFSFRG